MDRRRRLGLALLLAGVTLAGRASAHGGSLDAGARDSLVVPTWLFLTTGGAAVGASFLLASFVTDRSFIAAIHDWRREFTVPGRRLLAGAVSLLGVAGLAAVIVIGFLGPDAAVENAGYLLVWVGWWAGFTMTTYLVGNWWPALNPWRTIAGVLPSLDRPYPDRFGAWPAVVGLIALVYLEVVGPPAALADTLTPPVFIATLAVAYSVVTLSGALYYGTSWFDRADPVSRVFRYYGRVAPVAFERATDDDRAGDDAGDGRSFRLRLPGTALSKPRLVDGRDEVAFVVALLWATTFDGLVSTPAWRALLRPLGVSDLAARAVYLITMAAGFLVFYWVYRLAVGASRDLSEAHVSRA
jgi:protein-S-isoprenylcysteine O-methyltransferase Ste14